MLAKEQKQNKVALAVFGLANDRNYSHQRIGILKQLCSRPELRKKVGLFFFFFLELELNHFPKFLYIVLPVLAVNRPGCSEVVSDCICLGVLNGVPVVFKLQGNRVSDFTALQQLQSQPGVGVQWVQISATGMQGSRTQPLQGTELPVGST